MMMTDSEWVELVATRATGRGDWTAGKPDASCSPIIDGRDERDTAFIDHMMPDASDDYMRLFEFTEGFGWMLTPMGDALADRIIDTPDPEPASGPYAALAAWYPDRLIACADRRMRRPAERWFHDAGPLRLDRYAASRDGIRRMLVHDRLHPERPVLDGRRLDALIDAHTADDLIVTGKAERLTVGRLLRIIRHGSPDALETASRIGACLDDAIAVARLLSR